MKDNRSFIVAGTLFIIVLFGLLILFNPEAAPEQPGYWISFAVGIILGGGISLYLRAVWDPKKLELKDPNTRTADPKWMGPTAVLGVVAAKIISYIFAPEIQIMLVNLIFALFTVSFGYMAFQVWRHRPR